MIVFIVAVMALAGLGEGECPDDVSNNNVLASTQPEQYARNWYLGLEAINFYPRLHESEEEIDRKINRVLGWLPGWEEPTTFTDWRNRHFAWDFAIGVGRDLSPKTTLMVWAGGSKGIIKNKAQYGPLETDIRFTRTALFLTPELAWYPWDKVNYAEVADKKGGDWIRAALSEVKPYLAAASGYTWVCAEGEGKLKLPLLGTFFHDAERKDHHLLMFSPRLGIEMPLGKNSSFSVIASYRFYDRHSDEYNGPTVSLGYRWRF